MKAERFSMTLVEYNAILNEVNRNTQMKKSHRTNHTINLSFSLMILKTQFIKWTLQMVVISKSHGRILKSDEGRYNLGPMVVISNVLHFFILKI